MKSTTTITTTTSETDMETTRKYPRTLEQAFGPYARGPIDEQQDPMPAADRVVIATCCIGAIILIVMAALGWLS